MIFLKKFPKQHYTLFEQLLKKKNIPKLFEQHVFFINRRMQKPHMFSFMAESPSRWKHWNKSIGLVHITKQKRVPFSKYTILQPYPLTIPVWRMALNFLFFLAKKRKSYFLFSGNHELLSLSYFFDELLFKKFKLKLAKAIDFWIPGFIGNRKSMILPIRKIVAFPPKGFTPWNLRIKTFSRKFRFKQKTYLKHIDTYRFLRDYFFPECIFLLNSSKRAYAAGQEGFRKRLPIIALASSDSTNFGFSGSHFVLPAAVNLVEHLHYYCFLFFIVMSFAKQQFMWQEYKKFAKKGTPNLVYALFNNKGPEDTFLSMQASLQKYIVLYRKLLFFSRRIYSNAIVIPVGTLLAKSRMKKKKKLKSQWEIMYDEFKKTVTGFKSIPVVLDSVLKDRINPRPTFIGKIIFDRIGRFLYRPKTEDEIKILAYVKQKQACDIMYENLKLFLSIFIIQAIFFKSGSAFSNDNNITPVSMIKSNFLYTFVERLVKLLLKKPKLFGISPQESDFFFFSKVKKQLQQIQDPDDMQDLKFLVNQRYTSVFEKEDPLLKIKWINFFHLSTTPKILTRHLKFFDNLINYKKKTVDVLQRYGEHCDSRFSQWLQSAFVADIVNSKKITKNILFQNLHLKQGFISLGVLQNRLSKKKKKK